MYQSGEVFPLLLVSYSDENVDIGKDVALDLSEIHRFFGRCDEAYRRFRTFLMEDPVGGDPENNPIEWVPMSKW